MLYSDLFWKNNSDLPHKNSVGQIFWSKIAKILENLGFLGTFVWEVPKIDLCDNFTYSIRTYFGKIMEVCHTYDPSGTNP